MVVRVGMATSSYNPAPLPLNRSNSGRRTRENRAVTPFHRKYKPDAQFRQGRCTRVRGRLRGPRSGAHSIAAASAPNPRRAASLLPWACCCRVLRSRGRSQAVFGSLADRIGPRRSAGRLIGLPSRPPPSCSPETPAPSAWPRLGQGSWRGGVSPAAGALWPGSPANDRQGVRRYGAWKRLQ